MHIFDISEIRDCLIMKDGHVYRFRQNLRHKETSSHHYFKPGKVPVNLAIAACLNVTSR